MTAGVSQLMAAAGHRRGGGAAPVNTDLPVITTDGTPETGDTISCSDGTWDNTPTSFSYQWRRGATNIGADLNTYTLVAADIGQQITCRVTATNAAGSSTAASAAIVPVPLPTVLLNFPNNNGAHTGQGNARLDTSSLRLMIRMVAPKTGTIRNLWFSGKCSSGYGAGNYGTTEATIRAVNTNGTPASTGPNGGSVITDSFKLWTGGGTGGRLEGSIDTNSFAVGGPGGTDATAAALDLPVTAGQEFCVVFRNSDAAPGTNYFSINLCHDTSTGSGFEGAVQRNERDPEVTDLYYGQVDGRVVAGGSNNSGSTWTIPCQWNSTSAGSDYALPPHQIEYTDDFVGGIIYVGSTAISASANSTQTMVFPNLRSSGTCTHLCAYSTASATCNVSVTLNGVAKGTVQYTGTGHKFLALTTPFDYSAGQEIRVSAPWNSAGGAGLAYRQAVPESAVPSLFGLSTSFFQYWTANTARAIPLGFAPYRWW